MRFFSLVLVTIATLLFAGCDYVEFNSERMGNLAETEILYVPDSEFKYYKISDHYYEVPNLCPNWRRSTDPLINNGLIDIVPPHCCRGFSKYYPIDDDMPQLRFRLSSVKRYLSNQRYVNERMISEHNLSKLDNASLRKYHTDFNDDFFLLSEGTPKKDVRGLKGVYEFVSKKGLYFGHKIYVKCASYCEGMVLYETPDEISDKRDFPPYMRFQTLFLGEKTEVQFYNDLASVLSQIEILVEGFHVGTTQPLTWETEFEDREGE